MAIINPTEDQLNEWLSQQTMRGTIGGNRLADLASPQAMNTIRSSSGNVIDLNYAARGGSGIAPDGSRASYDPHVDGPRVLSRMQRQDGTFEVIKEVPAMDGFGRQSSTYVKEIETPAHLNPAELKRLDYMTKLADLQKKQADARGGVKPQLVDGQWVFPPSQDAPTGRAVPVEGFNKLGKALPNPAVKDLSAAGAAVEDSARLKNSFNTEYGGKTILGDMSNTLKRVFGDDTGQAQWWQDMDALQNQTRHNLFGSALTKTELQAWEKTSITPRMNPDQIVQNLARRQEIESRAASKLARAYTAAGYNKDQINELLGTAAEYVNQPAPPVKGQYKNENAPVPVRSEAEAMKLPKGTVFIMNGRRGVNR